MIFNVRMAACYLATEENKIMTTTNSIEQIGYSVCLDCLLELANAEGSRHGVTLFITGE